MNSKTIAFALVALAGFALTSCASTPAPTRVPIQALIPTAVPGALGGFDQNAWLFGTSTPTATPTLTGTPGPSPTLAPTPTPVNATTLKGKLLFLSSRSLPANYAPALSNLHLISPDMFKAFSGSAGGTVWMYDPTFGKVTPCDPPRWSVLDALPAKRATHQGRSIATPTPVPDGLPTPALLFG